MSLHGTLTASPLILLTQQVFPRPSHYAPLWPLKTRCGERKLPGLKREAHGDVWVINNRLSPFTFRGSQHGLSDRPTTIKRVNRWPACVPSGLVLPRTETRGFTHQARTASLADVLVFGVNIIQNDNSEEWISSLQPATADSSLDTEIQLSAYVRRASPLRLIPLLN
ncbi:hypothetical protein E2C01_058205 [Portunus trituberculatus]|uniref:Uncharacterized protein n=1 Tax=Portunus trituberculatus TaxID=210409 RepID=A0A5B7H5F6_PORTR|nr:hypothetical protein [Portunus trituberculatus]